MNFDKIEKKNKQAKNVSEGTESLEYELNDDGDSYSVVGCDEDETHIVIPNEYKGKPVTSIADSAFADYNSLEEVIIPNTITSIGKDAFYYCFNMTSINIPDSVTSIGDNAFHHCEGLEEVIIPNSVTSIGNYAFASSDSLEKIIIPNSVTKIGEYAFLGCYSLAVYAGAESRPDGWDDNWMDDEDVEIVWGYKCDTSKKCKHAGEDIRQDNNIISPNTDSDEEYEVTKSLEYELNDDGDSYTVVGCDKGETSVVIPSEYKGKPVASIAEDAFLHCDNLAKITLPDSLLHIGERAFSYCKIDSIVIPNNIESLEYGLFQYCENLTSVTLPKTLSVIGKNVFDGCASLSNIVLPNSVKTIDFNAFSGCASLKELVIPSSVSCIEDLAIDNCRKLIIYAEADSQPADWERLWNVNCPVVWGYMGEKGITNDGFMWAKHKSGNMAICGYVGEESTLNIPSIINGLPVTIISAGHFDRKNAIINVIIPNTVTSIKDYAFYDCINLTNVYIPDSVTSIGDSAFAYCPKLTICAEAKSKPVGWDDNCMDEDEVKVVWGYKGNTSEKSKHAGETIRQDNNIISPNTDSDEEYEGTKSLEYELNDDGDSYSVVGCDEDETHIVIPNEYKGKPVTGIAEDAFSDYENLKKVIIPNSVTSIGESAFFDCSSLVSVDIPDSVTNINDYTFDGCSALVDITIPSTMTSIGDYAFNKCKSLVNVDIPNSVTSLGWYAFARCESLKSINLSKNLESIGECAFFKCNSLVSVILPDSVVTIEGEAFGECRNLAMIYAETDIQPDGWEDDWNGDTEIVWGYRGDSKEDGKGTESLNYRLNDDANSYMVVYSVEEETRVVIPREYKGKPVTKIDDSAFADYNSLEEIIIPNTITSIGKDAFYFCCNVTSINIPDSVTSIGDNAFDNCNNLEKLIIHNGLTSIGDSAFASCDSLEKVIIPESVTSIGEYAFLDCASLKEINIPDSVTNIGDETFYGCYDLSSVTISKNLTNIGSNAFGNCESLEEIIIPRSVRSISDSAFSGCDNLTIYAEAESAPDGWEEGWNDDCEVVWGYKKQLTK